MIPFLVLGLGAFFVLILVSFSCAARGHDPAHDMDACRRCERTYTYLESYR